MPKVMSQIEAQLPPPELPKEVLAAGKTLQGLVEAIPAQK
jgi:hypothetical protein